MGKGVVCFFGRERLKQPGIALGVDARSGLRNGNSYESNTVFDELLYKTRFVIERTNAWLDSFKAVLVRFETNNLHWKGLLLLAFSAILLRKL